MTERDESRGRSSERPGALLVVLALLVMLASSLAAQQFPRAEWNEPQKPFKVFGTTYWVGTHGLGAVLITSDAGHVLVDGALPESVPQIAASIRTLGFKVEDVKLIVNSHVHFDHAGGISELQRLSGARVAASPATARALMDGASGPDDPQFGLVDPIARVDHAYAAHERTYTGRDRAPHARAHAGRHQLVVALVRGRAVREPGVRRQPEPNLEQYVQVHDQPAARRVREKLRHARGPALRHPADAPSRVRGGVREARRARRRQGRCIHRPGRVQTIRSGRAKEPDGACSNRSEAIATEAGLKTRPEDWRTGWRVGVERASWLRC